jgi:hypothetical protein
MKRRPERVEVGPRVGVGALQLLGSREAQRAQEVARRRQALEIGEVPGDPEVRHFDGAVPPDQDVRGFDVAVENAFRVERREAPRDLAGDERRAGRRSGVLRA